jgi:hypothetical protein
VATGIIAVGNVATGVVAFGNVARGFITVGNLSLGVIAFGNVGFGVLFGAGATFGVGLFSVAGVAALSVVEGLGGVVTLVHVSSLLGLLPLVLWGIASRAFPGEWGPRPVRREELALDQLQSGRIGRGIIRGKLSGTEPPSGLFVTTQDGELPLRCEDRAQYEEAGRLSERGELLFSVEQRERVVESGGLYREAPKSEREWVCTGVEEAPERAIFYHGAEIHYVLSWAWRSGALLGLLLWAVYHLFSLGSFFGIE